MNLHSNPLLLNIAKESQNKSLWNLSDLSQSIHGGSSGIILLQSSLLSPPCMFTFIPSSQLIHKSPLVRKHPTAWRAKWWIHPSCCNCTMIASIHGKPVFPCEQLMYVVKYGKCWVNDAIAGKRRFYMYCHDQFICNLHSLLFCTTCTKEELFLQILTMRMFAWNPTPLKTHLNDITGSAPWLPRWVTKVKLGSLRLVVANICSVH